MTSSPPDSRKATRGPSQTKTEARRAIPGKGAHCRRIARSRPSTCNSWQLNQRLPDFEQTTAILKDQFINMI